MKTQLLTLNQFKSQIDSQIQSLEIDRDWEKKQRESPYYYKGCVGGPTIPPGGAIK